jgi:hypothetical protein
MSKNTEEDIFVRKIKEITLKLHELFLTIDKKTYEPQILGFALMQYAAEMVVVDSWEGNSLSEKIENEVNIYRRCLLWNLSQAGRIKVYEMNGKTIITEDTQDK